MDVTVALASQYHATLRMLRQVIERCPTELWLDDSRENAFWRVAYHALFYGHLCLMSEEKAFTPWEGHREEYQFLGTLPWPPHDPPSIRHLQHHAGQLADRLRNEAGVGVDWAAS